MFSSMKTVILILVAAAFMGILLGFVKAALEQRKINKAEGKNVWGVSKEEIAARRAQEEKAREDKLQAEQEQEEKRQKAEAKKQKKEQLRREREKPKLKRLGEGKEEAADETAQGKAAEEGEDKDPSGGSQDPGGESQNTRRK